MRSPHKSSIKKGQDSRFSWEMMMERTGTRKEEKKKRRKEKKNERNSIEV